MSRKKLRYAVFALLAVAVVAAAAFAWLRTGGVKWPEFPAVNDKPVAVSDVLPDFSWRTGDVIPVTVYIKEAPGTVCDLKSIVVKGDAQLRAVDTYSENLPDGTRLIRLKLDLQAFVLKPVWNVTPFITYRAGEKQERKELELPSFEIGSSNTYDHRKIERTTKSGEKIELKDEHPKDQPAEYLVSYAWTTDVTVFTLSLMALVTAVWVLVTHKPEPKPVPPQPEFDNWRQETTDDVNAAMALLKAGNSDKATYIRLEKGLLRLFGLDSVPLPVIEAAADAGCTELGSLRHVLEYSHRAIYGHVVNDLFDLQVMSELLPEALEYSARFKGLPAAAPAPSEWGVMEG